MLFTIADKALLESIELSLWMIEHDGWFLSCFGAELGWSSSGYNALKFVDEKSARSMMIYAAGVLPDIRWQEVVIRQAQPM